jgi:hypothetical protein
MTGVYGNGLNFWRYDIGGFSQGPSVTFADNGNVGIGTASPVLVWTFLMLQMH